MTKNMTVGSPTKLILMFSFPLLIGNVFQQFYNMVDAIIVGRALGVEALAAVGATGSINFLVLGFVMGITSGFSVLVAQSFGAQDYTRLRQTVAI
ncbi:MAG: MATE family efflux transporter, partial [Lachnospiraceae bacterium]